MSKTTTTIQMKYIFYYLLAYVRRGIRYFTFIVVNDKSYAKRKYKKSFNKSLNLKNPQTFNEKIQYIKLYSRKDEQIVMVDKYKVREMIKEKIGDEYLIPLVDVYNNPLEIDFEVLPDSFILKYSHASGTNILCDSKKNFNQKSALKKLIIWSKLNYYYVGREWPYGMVEPKILCEELLLDSSGKLPDDYKFFCFKGKPKFIQVDIDRFTNHRRDFYNLNWEKLDMNLVYKNSNTVSRVPKNLQKMIELAEILSRGNEFIRVDFYNLNGKIYFGELTLYPENGFGTFFSDRIDLKLGELLEI